MDKKILSAGLLALAATLAGCPAQPGYPECKNDAACSGHAQICVNGFCRQCKDDAQCRSGQQCAAGVCEAKPECADNSACAPGLLCRAGKCTPECSEATAAADCGPGKRCIANRCAAAEECSGDDDCTSGKACVEGRCRAQGGLSASANDKIACQPGPIFFGYDDATIDSRARDALAEAWSCVSKLGFRRLVLSGNTDERGTTEYNLALGSRRAEAVRKYLIGLGGEGRKLRAVSYGKEKPADLGHDEGAWARNRRVEIDLEK